MDPTYKLCEISNSFTPQYEVEVYPTLSKSNELKYLSNIKTQKQYIIPSSILIDKFSSRVGTSFYKIKSALTVANLDIIASFLNKNINSWGQSRVDFMYRYLDLGSQDIGFIEYMQSRYPLGEGFLFTNKKLVQDIPLQKNTVDTRKLQILVGADRTGNLVSNSEWLTKELFNLNVNRFDLIHCNFEPSSINLIHQLKSSLNNLKDKGTILIKININNKFYEGLIQLLRYTFDEIYLIKPSNMNLNDNYYYLVGKNYDLEKSEEPLLKLNELKKINKEIIEFIQIESGTENYLNEIINQTEIFRDKIDKILYLEYYYTPRKALIFWNLPITPEDSNLPKLILK